MWVDVRSVYQYFPRKGSEIPFEIRYELKLQEREKKNGEKMREGNITLNGNSTSPCIFFSAAAQKKEKKV